MFDNLDQELAGEWLTIDQEAEKRIANKLFLWLVGKVSGSDMPGLDEKLLMMKDSIDNLSKNLELEYDGNSIVVNAVGSAKTTLAMFKYGTMWFDPHEDVNNEILSALLSPNS